MHPLLFAVLPVSLGFVIDLIIGDPHFIPHPVAGIGKLISLFESVTRRAFPKSKKGERLAGLVIWFAVAMLSAIVPAAILFISYKFVSPYLMLGLESVMCWQILATKSLKTESMKVYRALKRGDLPAARKAVSMIVGRDTENLDADAVTRAAVETVAENTSDGVIAPLVFLAIGGAPLGFFYKAINTMDSMLGYIDPPYRDIGFVPAKADDAANFIPARLSAILMLISGAILRLDIKNGLKIFKRDRKNHKSPNSAQTESVCAGLLGVQLAGPAYYRGVLHDKPYIGDPIRNITPDDIKKSCRLLYATAALAFVLFTGLRALVFALIF